MGGRATWTVLIAVALLTGGPSLASTVPDASGGADEAPEEAKLPADVDASAQRLEAVREQVRDLGASVSEDPSPSGKLGHLGLEAEERSAPDIGRVSFEEAMDRLYAAADLQAPQDLEEPPEGWGPKLAPAIVHVARAVELVEEALAPLSEEERDRLEAYLSSPAQPATREIAQLVDRVEVPKLTAAGVEAAQALDVVNEIEVDDPPETSTVVVPSPCAPTGTTNWVDPTGLVEIGTTNDDRHLGERVLLVDPGGDDCYDNHAGSATPISGLPVPVSLSADLGGDDRYVDRGAHPPGEAGQTFGQGVGVLGVGMLLDRWGEDVYEVSIQNTPSQPCTGAWHHGSYALQLAYGQGVGRLGVGALFELGGNDDYETQSRLNWSDCHWIRSTVLAQGTGVQMGVGVLADDQGNDRYNASAVSTGGDDNFAGTAAQGAASGGLGALVDAEGHDDYEAFSKAFANADRRDKGNFATTTAQGSAFATFVGSQRLPSGPGVLDHSGGMTQLAVGLCDTHGSPVLWLHAGDQRACQAASTAFNVDILGEDTFTSRAKADHNGHGCEWSTWAIVSSQGSAGWAGLAVQATFDGHGPDRHTLDATAIGEGCSDGQNGVRALVYGQGYGGAVQWDRTSVPADNQIWWLLPTARYAFEFNLNQTVTVTDNPLDRMPPDQAAIGLSLHGGSLDTKPCRYMAVSPSPDQPIFKACDNELAEASDLYQATARSIDEGSCSTCPNEAQTWVQGASKFYHEQYVRYRDYWTMGVGVNADWQGDDTYKASTFAEGGGDASAQTVAQAIGWATEGRTPNTGILANAGGSDAYDARAYVNGDPSDPGASRLAQAMSFGPEIVSIPCDDQAQCIQLVAPRAVGILLEVGGWDGYSEGPPCQGNGGLGSYQLWGDLGVCSSSTATGDGLSVGLDVLSGVDV